MKRDTILLAILCLWAAGCNQPTVTESKGVAYEKWSASRAKVLYSLARDHLNSGHVDDACRKAEEALQLDPTHADLKILLSKAYIEKGNYPQAIGLLKELCESETPPKAPLAEVYYLLGVAQEKEGMLADALASYQQAAERDRASSAPILAVTEVLVALGRTEAAQEFLSCHLERMSAEPAPYELAGRLAMMRKQYAQAAQHYRVACDLDAKNVRYPELLATAQCAAGAYPAAAETLSHLLRRKTYRAPAWVYVLYGDCELARNRPAPAEKAYQHACELRPEQASYWARLAKSALVQNHLTKAIRSAHQARTLEPDHLEASMVLGYALLRIGQLDPAVTVLSAAVKAHPKEKLLLCLLGRAYDQLGRHDLARKFYDAVAHARPDDPLTQQLLAANAQPQK